MSHKRQSQPPSRAKGRTRGHRAEAKMSRREFVRSLGVAAIAAGAAAEGSWSDLRAVAYAATSPAKELSVGLSLGPWNGSVEYLFKKYGEATGTAFKTTKAPYIEHYRRMVQAMQRQDANYDFIIIDPAMYGTIFFKNKLVTPIKEIDPSWKPDPNLLEPHIKVGTYEGITYALPIVGNTQLLFYRSDVTRAAGFAGPPKTINEMIEVNKKVTDTGRPFYGCIVPAKANYDVVYTSLAYVKSAGGDIFATESGPDWTIRFTSPESIKGYKAWLSLRPWSPPDSANVHWAELMNYILTDRAWGGLTVAAQVFQIDDPKFSKVPGKIDVAMPLIIDGGTGKPAPILGTWSMAIPLRAPRKAEALAFMKWALTRENQREFALQGGIAVRRDVLTDPGLTRDPKNRWFAAELESSALGLLRPQMEHWIEVQDRMVPYLQKAFTNEVPLVAALNAAAKDVQELLDRYGYKHGPLQLAKE